MVENHISKSEEEESREEIRTLIVEDDKDVLNIFKTTMRFQKGFEVDYAEKTSEALEKLRQAKEQGRPIDLVLTDLGLADKELGGFEISSAIKKEKLANYVVLYTANHSASELTPDELKEKGVDELIRKPAPTRDLTGSLIKARGMIFDNGPMVPVRQF